MGLAFETILTGCADVSSFFGKLTQFICEIIQQTHHGRQWMMIPRHCDFLVLSSQERIIYTSLEWRNTPPSQNAFPEKNKGQNHYLSTDKCLADSNGCSVKFGIAVIRNITTTASKMKLRQKEKFLRHFEFGKRNGFCRRSPLCGNIFFFTS